MDSTNMLNLTPEMFKTKCDNILQNKDVEMLQ